MEYLSSRLATVITYAMAGEPSRRLSQEEEDPEYEDGEQDAEGEEDIPVEQYATPAADEPPYDGEGSSDADAEGEIDDELESEAVGAVKLPPGEADGDSSEEEEDEENDSNPESSGSEAAPGSSSEESDAEEEWQAESDAAEDAADVTMLDPNRCM